MTEPMNRALLPAGLHDVLPREAAFEATIVERLMAEFASNGFERVKPPLIEFEASLLSGPGAAMATQTFRLMDPVSQRMLAIRPDMTLQVARIATTRLANEPRPLRLSYGGQVLRVKGSQLRPERQFGQVGVELIGTLQPTADAEVVLLAYRALKAAGVTNISVDLNVPTLVSSVCRGLDLPEDETFRLRQALDRKDAAEVAAVGGKAADLLTGMMGASGPADRAIELLAALDLPETAEADRRRLNEVVRLIRTAAPELMLTVDPVEHRGFEYQTGISFTLFSRGVRGELGRGGRYRAGGKAPAGDNGSSLSGEPATGFTLYLDTVLRAVPDPAPIPKVFLPIGTDPTEGERLRAEGWVTVRALDALDDPAAEARRLRCTHVFAGGQILSAV
ncbi:ATP phosphoribosyltransferase [Skermanella stibiiresistens SB22]|uniref:ATP phosphoribosyltransferase regulatory subunit n=1 Tax=Skermanella stibiiresistens SB22 TaxID=1385369 RepID=W9GW50_9PROT|nr:ATP phosphoribosyltransferase regulatory subunit [Skermanella stibiiresistens]EWY36881.1 ATP phosphoribosyltransferase [Skermanella stibiiresistens SB22]